MQTWQSVLFFTAWLITAIKVGVLVLLWHGLVTELYRRYIQRGGRKTIDKEQ